jgi:non-ribosomal peptide synthetase component F
VCEHGKRGVAFDDRTECVVFIGGALLLVRLPETEPLIGFFANTLALRTDLTGQPTFRDLVRRVKEIGRASCRERV